MEGGGGLRQGLSVRAGRRSRLHPGDQRTVPASSADCLRAKPDERGRIHPRGRGGAGHRPDWCRRMRSSIASASGSTIRPALHQHGDRRAGRTQAIAERPQHADARAQAVSRIDAVADDRAFDFTRRAGPLRSRRRGGTTRD